MVASAYPRRGPALAVLCAMSLTIVLDSTIVAVAVPAIQLDLGFSPAGVAWVVNGYLIGFAGFLLLAGRLGDLLRARRVFPALLVMGLGIGVVISAIIMLAMSGAGSRETGLVSGLTNTAQQAGAALGLAVLAVVAARVSGSRLAAGAAEVAALRDGYSRAFLTAAGFALGALIIGAFVLRRGPAPGAEDGGLGDDGIRLAGDPAVTEAAAAGPVPLDPPLCRQ